MLTDKIFNRILDNDSNFSVFHDEIRRSSHYSALLASTVAWGVVKNL